MIKVEKVQVPDMTGTKWDLFVTAISMFAEKGFANVSVRDIAATLKINSASIYNHFSSKNDFLTEAYNFYRYNYYTSIPPLDELLTEIPSIPPQEVWRKIQPIYDPELLDIMTKIALVAIDERRRDPKAQELVSEVFVKMPRKYLSAILSAMIEQDVIEPLDLRSFTEVHSAFNLYASVRMGGYHTMSAETWHRGHEFIFSFIRPKNYC